MGWMLVGRAKLEDADGTDGWRQEMEALLPEGVSARTGWPDCGDVVVLAFGARGGLAGRLDEIREALAPMFVGAPAWLEANDAGVWPLQPAPRETVAEVLTVTIQHGEDDLREWPMANQPPDTFATIDRRAVSCVWGGPAWCWVHVSGGPPVMLGAPYADVVAWWRGGR